MNNVVTIRENKKDLLDITVLVLLIIIIFSNATVLRRYLIIMFPLAAIMLAFSIIIRKREIHINIQDVLWYLVLMYLIIMLPFSYNIKESLIHVCYYGVSVIIMVLLRSKANILLTLIKSFKIIATIFSVVTILSFINKNIIPTRFHFMFDYDRLLKINHEIGKNAFSGLAGEVSYNMFSIAIGFGIIVSSYLIYKKSTLSYNTLILIMCFALLLTQKRSILVILLLTIIFLMLVLLDKSVTKKVFKIIAIFLFLIMFIFFAFPNVLRIFERFFIGGQLYLSGRNTLWSYAMDMFLERPLFGYGMGSYNIYCNYMGYFAGKQHAHNIYFQLLAETGLVGFLLFSSVFIFSLFKTIRLIKKTVKLTNNYQLRVLSVFSLYLQLFFLIYGLVGIPLYNFTQFLVYLISISISAYVEKETRFLTLNTDSV